MIITQPTCKKEVGCLYRRGHHATVMRMLSVRQFFAMRPVMQSITFLYWIHVFAGSTIGVFAQIYLYQLFESVTLNLLAAIVFFTGIMLGFCGYGVLAARYHLNTKHGFLLSFMCEGVGILLLPLVHDMVSAICIMTIIGIGSGLFWLTVHTYELVETKDHERDRYSTFLAAGNQMVSLIGPACATSLIWIAHQFAVHELTLLFVVIPLVYLIGFRFFGALTDYYPQPIKMHDVLHFVTDRRNRIAQIYLAGDGATHILHKAVLPLISIMILGTALHVGSFNMIFAVVSALALLVVGAYRHPNNRLLIFAVTTMMTVALALALGSSLTFVMLVIYTVGMSIVEPIKRVSQHTIDLQTMDSIGHHESDFYPTMIFRDFSLWIWRVVFTACLLIVVIFIPTDQSAVAMGMYFIALAYGIAYFGAWILLKSYTTVQTGETSALADAKL